MRKIFLFLFLLIEFSISNAFSQSPRSYQQKASEVLGHWSCDIFESDLYDVAYVAIVDQKLDISSVDVMKDFSSLVDQKEQLLSEVDRRNLKILIQKFYQLVLDRSHQNLKELLEKVTAAEAGIQLELESEALQKQLKSWRSELSDFRKGTNIKCPLGSDGHRAPIANPLGLSLAADKVLGVAYQSCAAVNLRPMTKETETAKGIEIVGTHPDGVGKKRRIQNLNQLLQTDYYLQNFPVNNQCRDIRSSPMIYDYGGKPNTPTNENVLDFFVNDGDGTNVLGIDCSGYVFSSIGAAGFRLEPNKKLKPILVHGINAAAYMEPQKNGMGCFQKIKVGASGTLLPGDIISKVGHVVVVKSIGPDPLGILKVEKANDCDRISIGDFDFVVSQSSPSKGGIGINQYVAKDFLSESANMKAGLEAFARSACKARLANTDREVLGELVQVTRHKMTSECLDNPIALRGESCLNSCLNSF